MNGTAHPVLTVKRRKYRLRFLGASIARVYELSSMRSNVGPIAARDLGLIGDELQGQYRLARRRARHAVDALGNYQLDVRNSPVPRNTRVSLESARGGVLLNQTVR